MRCADTGERDRSRYRGEDGLTGRVLHVTTYWQLSKAASWIQFETKANTLREHWRQEIGLLCRSPKTRVED